MFVTGDRWTDFSIDVGLSDWDFLPLKGVSRLIIEFKSHDKWDYSVCFMITIVFVCYSESACFGSAMFCMLLRSKYVGLLSSTVSILNVWFCGKIEAVVDKDDEDLKKYFNECFDFIDEAKRLGGGVLVHCFAGRSRR